MKIQYKINRAFYVERGKRGEGGGMGWESKK